MLSKYVFYRRFLDDDVLSIGARIVWSWLYSEVVMRCYKEGRPVGEWLQDGMCRFAQVRYGNFPSDFGMSRFRFDSALSELRDAGVWDGESVLMRVSVYEDGWFHLRTDDKLSGWDLVLYSWLADRAEMAEGTMTDVPATKVAPLFGLSVASIRKRKSGLHKKGYLKVVWLDGHCYSAVKDLVRISGSVKPKYDECGDFRALRVLGYKNGEDFADF